MKTYNEKQTIPEYEKEYEEEQRFENTIRQAVGAMIVQVEEQYPNCDVVDIAPVVIQMLKRFVRE